MVETLAWVWLSFVALGLLCLLYQSRRSITWDVVVIVLRCVGLTICSILTGVALVTVVS